MSNLGTFPHCDPRILHAPKECRYCDAHPDWQELRKMWGINFTGERIENDTYNRTYLPCPSEVDRPLSDINKWDGNVPYKEDGSINTEAPMFAGAVVVHDPDSRHVDVFKPNPDCGRCNGTGSVNANDGHRCICTRSEQSQSWLQKIRDFLDIL